MYNAVNSYKYSIYTDCHCNSIYFAIYCLYSCQSEGIGLHITYTYIRPNAYT